jgi:cytochrome b
MTASASRKADFSAMPDSTVRAWDLPTRVFHWSLVTLIVFAPVTANLDDPLKTAHKAVGYSILIVVVWRFLWGFLGGSTSRFSLFFPWPWKVIPYLIAVFRGTKSEFLGHNPVGSVMVMLLLAAAAAQGIAGLFTSDDIVTAGPLYPLASSSWNKLMAVYHESGFIVILSLVALHVLANVLYSAFSKVNLIGAMISGKKPAYHYGDLQESQSGSIILAIALLGVSAAIVLGGIWLAGGDFAAGPVMDFS